MKKTLIAFTVLLAAFSPAAQTNVIFITIDDLNKDSLGIHGCPVEDITPNLDALAQSGLRFEHCHVAAANCTPSRNVMMSGMYSHNNGVLSVSNEGSGNHNASTTMPDVFNAAGFHTGIMGKNGHQQPYDPYYGWDEEYDTYGSTRDPENIYEKLTNAFANAASEGNPLFFNLNIYDPHVGWYKWDHKEGEPVTSYSDPDPSRVYSPSEVPYPSFMPPLSDTEMDFGNGYGVMDEVAAYYNSVKRADDSIGRVLDAIEDAGAADTTIIMLISDHGAEFPGGKTMLWNHSTVSPMFVVWPGITSSNTVNDTHMINSVDFLPSFCELTGQPIPADVDGKSFIPILKGKDPADWPEYIYKEHNVAHNMRAVQTTNLLYIFNPWSDGTRTPSTVTDGHKCYESLENAAASGTNAFATAWLENFEHRTVEELYDITTDPNCFTNLFTNSAYAAELASMQSLLEQQMSNCGDDEMLHAFTNRTDQTVLDQFMDDDAAMRTDMKNSAAHTRDVFFDPRDDWHVIGETIFEPSGNWGIWEAQSSGINHDSSNGYSKSGDSCIEFNGGAADISRLIVSNAIDTSVFEQLKLDAIFMDDGAFSSGAALSVQYNDGTGWQTFQTITSEGSKNLTFDLSAAGSPEAILFGIQADMNESGGSIYMDHARLTAWQDWSSAPTNAPFDASSLGHVRLTFNFECENFSGNDSLLLEYYNGSAWEPLKAYGFDYTLLTNQTYADVIDLTPSDITFASDMEFRFRSESTGSGQAFTISSYTIETRPASVDVVLIVPPEAYADAYSADAPAGIVISEPGILDNDVSGTGGSLTAAQVSDVSYGILELNSDGSFVYAATNGYTGGDSFTYAAYDGNAYSATTTVSLTINEAAQTLDPVIFYDDFESGDVIEGGWDFDDGAKVTNYMSGEAYSGDYKANIRNGGMLFKTVSTEDYTDIIISYACIWNEGDAYNADEMLTVEWSSNLTDWTEIDTYQTGTWGFYSNSLPASADNLSSLTLRFNVTSDAWKEKAYIDEVKIEGTPDNPPAAIFFDDFESQGFDEGGWTIVEANVTTQYMSTAAYNGSFGANLRSGGQIMKTVSTEGYTDIQLNYWRSTLNLTNAAEYLSIAWSTNGTDWAEIDTTSDPDWNHITNSLPAAAENQPALSIRFDVESNKLTERGYIDDVLIQGISTSSASTITSFADWAATHGVTTNSEYMLDYAFNINPHLSNSYTLSAGGDSGLPDWDTASSTNRLVVDFVRRKKAADLTYTAQFGGNLMSNWTDAVSGETITAIDDEFERVSISDHMTTETASNRFGRVTVQQQ